MTRRIDELRRAIALHSRPMRQHDPTRDVASLKGTAPAPLPAPPVRSPAISVIDIVTVERRVAAPLVEIKGLGNALQGVRGAIKGVRSLAADVQDVGGKLAAELKDVHAQIQQARDDLRSEAETLGNSPPSSEVSGG